MRQFGVLPEVKAQQLRAAMSDPLLQARFLEVTLLYALTAVGASPPKGIDKIFNRLGPEAVPAVVGAINFAAANRLGTC